MCAAGQCADFIGYHRKTPTLFTCAGRFNRGIEREQIGLFGNTTNHIHHAANLFTVTRQVLDHGNRFFYLAGQVIDVDNGAIDHLLALPHIAIGSAGGIGSKCSVACHFLHRGRHFVHCGGHLFHFGFLLIHIRFYLAGCLGCLSRCVLQ